MSVIRRILVAWLISSIIKSQLDIFCENFASLSYFTHFTSIHQTACHGWGCNIVKDFVKSTNCIAFYKTWPDTPQ
jgi:hypothetical protein